MYSIKAITSATGIGAETLRAWERRYQAIVPERDDSGRRSYSQQDFEKLQLLAYLTRQGHAISKLAALKVPELQQLLNSDDSSNKDVQELVEQMVRALQDYRMDRCENLLKRALLAHEPLPYARNILTPALKAVGQLWHENKINIAQEHMFSECVKRILLGMVNTLYSISINRPGMLFATPCNEPHEFGILMCCLLAAEQQYNCYYLGPNLPTNDMLDAVRKLKIDVLVLSLIKTTLETSTIEALAELAQASQQEKFDLWIGGAGAELWLNEYPEQAANCQIIKDIDEFYTLAAKRRFG